MTEKAAVLFTGGKDSTFACERLRSAGVEVVCLITLFSENRESYMLHTSSIEVAELSAQALSIPIVLGRTQGRKEDELVDIERTVKLARDKFDFTILATGGISSVYQKARIESITTRCGLLLQSPIWGIDQKDYMWMLLAGGYKTILTSVSAQGLNCRWLGRELDARALQELEMLATTLKFNIAFEGGEAETLVIDCPLFKHFKIRIVESEAEWNGYFGRLRIKKAELVSKW